MIISRDAGTYSVDRETRAKVDMIFRFRAQLVEQRELPASGWDFERDLILGKFGTYIGYSIAAVQDGHAQSLSAVGGYSDGGHIYVTDSYIAIVYAYTSGFSVVKAPGAKYERGTLSAALPTGVCYTGCSRLVGQACTSYAYVNGVEVEMFEASTGLISYPSFSTGVIVDGRLRAAYGITTGTWNMDVLPESVEGLRKSLLNRWRDRPNQVTLPSDEGVDLTDTAMADQLASDLKRGYSLRKYDSFIRRWKRPSSLSYLNSGVLWLAVIPDINVVSRHWENVDSFGAVQEGGVLEACLEALIKAETEEQLKEVCAQSSYVFVNQGVLAAILMEYRGKYQTLKQNAMAEILNRLQTAVDGVLEAQREIESNLGLLARKEGVAGDAGLSGFGMGTDGWKAIDALSSEADVKNAIAGGVGLQFRFRDPMWMKIPAAVDNVNKVVEDIARLGCGFMFSYADPQYKDWDEVKQYNEAYAAGKAGNVAPGAVVGLDKDALIDGLRGQMDTGAGDFYELIARIEQSIKEYSPSVYTGGCDGGNACTKWDHEHKCHTDYSNDYYKFGPRCTQHSFDREDGQFSLANLALQGGFPVNNGVAVHSGNRQPFYQKNSGIDSISLSVVRGQTWLTLRVRWAPLSLLLGNQVATSLFASKVLLNTLSDLVRSGCSGWVGGADGQAASLVVVFKGWATTYCPVTADCTDTKKPELWVKQTYSSLNTDTSIKTRSTDSDRAFSGHGGGKYHFYQATGRVSGCDADEFNLYQVLPAALYEVKIPLNRDPFVVDVDALADSRQAQIGALATTFQQGVEETLSNCQVEAFKWLIQALRSTGLLSDVKLCGVINDLTYVTPQTLAAVSDCVMANANEVIALIDEMLEGKDYSDLPKDKQSNAWDATGNTQLTASLTQLRSSLKAFAAVSTDKVWIWPRSSGIPLSTDYNLIGWYLKA